MTTANSTERQSVSEGVAQGSVTIAYEWQPFGVMTLDGEGRLSFPAAPTTPAIYRFNLPDGEYIGEAANLRRRFNGYRNPAAGQQTNVRMNPVLWAAVPDATIDVVEGATITVAGVEHRLDLTSKSARLLVENAAITLANVDSVKLRNLQ